MVDGGNLAPPRFYKYRSCQVRGIKGGARFPSIHGTILRNEGNLDY